MMLAIALGCGEDAPPAAGSGTATNQITFGVSDAPVGALASVTITIDRITLNRPGDDVIIETFPNDEPGEPDTDTITVDLLDYQGLNNKIVVENIDVEVGHYQNLRLSIIDDDIDLTFVEEEEDGARKELEVPSGELKLGGFEVIDGDPQVFVIEFGLNKSMTYNPGPPGPDRYILKPTGVRIIDVEQAVSITGAVDSALFDGSSPCDEKQGDEVAVGNVMYLYAGHGLAIDDLGDLFDPAIDSGAADTYVQPYAAETVASNGDYFFAYLPAGSYTLAFSCEAAMDDPDIANGIMIPSPSGEWVELLTQPGEDRVCDFPIVDGDCG
jgi:hypothetical protein